MSGLRPRERDASLPARAGDPALAAPAPEEIARAWRAHLAAPESAEVESIEWTHARWKPGVSLTCAYELRLTDGIRVPLAAKRYADGKDRLIARRVAAGGGRAWLADERLALFLPESDRELAGLDARTLARAAERAGLAPPRSVRRHRLGSEILRYKPERRAVLRLDLRLRDADVDRLRVLARLHPRHRAGAIADRRNALRAAGGEAGLPPFLGADVASGYLFEGWLELDVAPPGTFHHAAEAGRLLAPLHRVPLGAGVPPDPDEEADLAPLFALDVELERGFASRSAVPPLPATAWIHGDLHPDQVARERSSGRPCLVDLDRTGPGDPLRDLGSWIADHLDEVPGVSLATAAHPLLESYETAGGPAMDERRLEQVVADELVRRGAAAIRRLERGAVEHARRALEQARDVSRGSRVHT